MIATVKIGFTQSDLASGYSSFDGYREGARQEIAEHRFEVGDFAPEQVAEAVFAATNAPIEVIEAMPLTRAIYLRLRRAAEAGEYVRSLSVGDTVEVDGVRLACDRFGWKRL